MGCMPLTCPHSGCQLGFWVFALMFCTRGFVYLRNLNLLTGITTNLFSARECLVLYTQILISGVWFDSIRISWRWPLRKSLITTRNGKVDKGFIAIVKHHQKKICWKRFFFFQFIPTVNGTSILPFYYKKMFEPRKYFLSFLVEGSFN